jgi:hypothetical protein
MLISSPLPCLGGLGLGAQDFPAHVRAKLFARDASQALDARAVVGWDAGLSPAVDHGMAVQPKITGKFGDPAVKPDRAVKWGFGRLFHGCIVDSFSINATFSILAENPPAR